MPLILSVSAQAAESYLIPGLTNANASGYRIPCLKNNKGRGLSGRGGRIMRFLSVGLVVATTVADLRSLSTLARRLGREPPPARRPLS